MGIAVERSLEMAVGLLGIMKSGGSFVPLDTAYPRERLAFMLRDSRVGLLLTQEFLRERLPEAEVELIFMDSGWEAIALESGENLTSEVSGANLAYIIYTSGSTGQPRGVLVTHRGLLNHNVAVAKLYDLRPADRVLQFCSLSFDIAIEEIFPAWLSGAEVVLRSDEMLDVTRFSHRIEQEKITVLDLPTAFWHSWVRSMSVDAESLPESLRLVVVGGEEASRPVYETWRECSRGRVRWLNTYGPTEATIIATAYEPAESDQRNETAKLAIGRPIANARIYILDSHLSAVPVGLAGELYIGGEGVARGYWNNSGLTAERFLPDPFSSAPGSRMYRTGDLARWRPDGTIEFLGRVDAQVKIRGFRVEPGEVEAAILRSDDVSEAVVVARDNGSDERLLTAYVVGRRGRTISVDELRRTLKDVLPRYLVPSAFVVLDSLPLTPAGKVDHRALPPPDRSGARMTEGAIAPRNFAEAQLLKIWEEVLGVGSIGVTDDFFDMGGHSLVAVRAVARIEECFGKRISLSAFVRHATIEELATMLQEPLVAHAGSPVVPLSSPAESTERPVFWVHPVGGSVLCYTELARLLARTRPSFGLEAVGLEDDVAPETSIEAMADRYVQAMRELQPEGPYYLGGWSLGGVVAFEIARRLAAQMHEVATLILIDCHSPRPGMYSLDEPSIRRAFVRDLMRAAGRSPSLSEGALSEVISRTAAGRILEFEEIEPALIAEFGCRSVAQAAQCVSYQLPCLGRL